MHARLIDLGLHTFAMLSCLTLGKLDSILSHIEPVVICFCLDVRLLLLMLNASSAGQEHTFGLTWSPSLALFCFSSTTPQAAITTFLPSDTMPTYQWYTSALGNTSNFQSQGSPTAYPPSSQHTKAVCRLFSFSQWHLERRCCQK